MRTTIALGLVLAGCPKAGPVAERSFTILAVNDTYRADGVAELGVGGFARLRTLRADLEAHGPVLVLHGGDFLYPSLQSREFRGAQMVDALNRLDGDPTAFDPLLFVVPGNHELERTRRKDAADLVARIDESGFVWLAANVAWAADEGGPLVAGENLVPRALVDVGGVRVGLVGVTTGREAEYVAEVRDPIATVRAEVAALRAEGAEVVVALTHLDARDDRALLEALPGAEGPDVVIGGHDHAAMALDVGGRFVLKADADAVTATVARVRVGAGVAVEPSLVLLGPESPTPDPALAASADDWARRFADAYCGREGQPADCLDTPLGRSAVPLVAEELRIRRFETNLGSWLADLALAAVPDADVALLNAGGIRLNRDLPAGPITRRHVEEMLPYPTKLKVIAIPGRVLRDEVLPHAVSDWTGSGHFLQVAGVRFTFDPASGVRAVTLRGEPVADDAVLRVVVPDFLVDPTMGDQDGYSMLGPSQVVAEGPALKDLVLAALAASPDGIAPVADGRICNTAEGACP